MTVARTARREVPDVERAISAAVARMLSEYVSRWRWLSMLTGGEEPGLSARQLAAALRGALAHAEDCPICDAVAGGARLDCEDLERLRRRACKLARRGCYYAGEAVEPAVDWVLS